MKEHTPLQKLKRWPTEYLPDTIQNILPHSLLIILMPIGLLGLRAGAGWSPPCSRCLSLSTFRTLSSGIIR